MDQNAIAQLYDLIGNYLPPAAQAIVVALLAVFGIQVGRRKLSKKTTGSVRGSGLQNSTETSASVGKSGPGATRDLEPNEIRGLRPSYEPDDDDTPDPGEVVWTWVPYVEHDGRGKDRPVLIIARLDDHSAAGCYLSTKAHDGFISVGTGNWDSKGRESFLNPKRVLIVSDSGMRREGSRLSKTKFEAAATQVMRVHGIS